MSKTRQAIESKLLKGELVEWQDPVSRETGSISLRLQKQRSLFRYLLNNEVRDISDLNEPFLSGIKAAFDEDTDPAIAIGEVEALPLQHRTWMLQKIECYGYGGVNTHGGGVFTLDLESESLCLEGPNGSGKTSLVGAIIWALTGYRYREQQGLTRDATQRRDVFDPITGTRIGDWPPVAALPAERSALDDNPEVWVRLTFHDCQSGKEARVERRLARDESQLDITGPFHVDDALLENGLLMPSRLAHLRFGEKDSKLYEAIQVLTGFEPLAELGDFVSQLCHRSRAFLNYAKNEKIDQIEQRYKADLNRAAQGLVLVEGQKPSLRTLEEFADPNVLGVIDSIAKELEASAASHFATLTSDLHPNIDTGDATDQKRVLAAVQDAKYLLRSGIDEIPSLALMKKLSNALASGHLAQCESSLNDTIVSYQDALRWKKRQETDNKLRLKAMAARWHKTYHSGETSITECPLCAREFQRPKDDALRAELEELREAAAHAEQLFDGACDSLQAHLLESVSKELRPELERFKELDPKKAFLADLKAHFVDYDPFAKVLLKAHQISQVRLSEIASDAKDGLPFFRIDESVIPIPADRPTKFRKTPCRVHDLCAAHA